MLARLASGAGRASASGALARVLSRGASAARRLLPRAQPAGPRARPLSTEAPPPHPLADFLDPYDVDPLTSPPGRAWNAEELRKKSSTDLEELWIVLCKERNMLLSSRYHHSVMKTDMKFPERLASVRVSMARLKSVVRERNMFETSLAEERKRKRFEAFMRPPPPPPKLGAELEGGQPQMA